MAQPPHFKGAPLDLSYIPHWYLYQEFCCRFNSLVNSKVRQEDEVTALTIALNNERARVQHYQQNMVACDPKNVEQRLTAAHSALVTEEEAHRQLQDRFKQLKSQFDQEMINLNDVKRKLQGVEAMLVEKAAAWQSEHTRAEALQEKFDKLAKRIALDGSLGIANSQLSATHQKKRVARRGDVTRSIPIIHSEAQELTVLPVSQEQELRKGVNSSEDDSDCVKVSIVDVADS